MSNREHYVGAALTQILEVTGFRSIRKASNAFGHYEVNGSCRVLIRHSASAASPWLFTLRERDLELLRQERASERRAFLCLVCRDEHVCILTIDQVDVVVDLAAEEVQTIRVYSRRNSSIDVRGSASALDGKIPKHAFPGRIFHHGFDPDK